jgi:hypothetical protein
MKSLVIFALLFCLDFVYTRWTQAIAQRKPYVTAGWAGGCYLLTGLATLQWVNEPWLLVPAIAGCMVGSFVAVKSHAPHDQTNRPS